jgi:hypothetical protein
VVGEGVGDPGVKVGIAVGLSEGSWLGASDGLDDGDVEGRGVSHSPHKIGHVSRKSGSSHAFCL